MQSRYYHFKMIKLIFKLFAVFSIMALLPGCNFTGMAASEIPRENSAEPSVYFCPGEDCGKIMEQSINSAKKYAYCAFYDLDLKNVINSLSLKSKTSDVKIVMDSSTYESQISGNGLRQDNNNQLMHNKFCVIDDETVVTGSFNPTFNDNFRNNNNLVVIHSGHLASNYKDEFAELWEGDFGEGGGVKTPSIFLNGNLIENYFCPEDECASKVIEETVKAQKSIYFMTFSFTNEQIADSIIKKRGIDVRGIFDASQASSKYSQLERMKGFGLDVKKDSNKYKLHHKVFIIDNETVVTGSFNPTASGDGKNDENILIFHDKAIAEKYLDEFDRLWE